jgi:uncharacterized protein YlxW (UPF0749 family)
MADVWTSQSELVTRIIMDIKGNDDAHTAMANALHRKQKVVDDACVGLQQKYESCQADNATLHRKIAELEKAVRAAERTAWGSTADPP